MPAYPLKIELCPLTKEEDLPTDLIYLQVLMVRQYQDYIQAHLPRYCMCKPCVEPKMMNLELHDLSPNSKTRVFRDMESIGHAC